MAELTAEQVKKEVLEYPLALFNGDYQPFFNEIFNDKAFLMECLSKENYGSVFRYATDFSDDKEIALLAIKDSPFSFQFASDRLKDDDEVATLALSGHGDNFQHLSERLRGSKEMMFLALHSLPENEFTDRWVITAVASEELRKDKEVAREILKYYHFDIKNIHESLLDDFDFIREMVETEENGDMILHFVSDRLKADREFIKYAVSKSHYLLAEASDELKDDDEIVRLALDNSPYAIEYASDRFKDNKDIILGIVKKNPGAIQCASERLRDDYDVVMAAVSQKGSLLEYASKRLLGDKEVVMAALDSGDCNNLLGYVSEELRNDKEVVFTAIVNGWHFDFRYASPSLKADREFVLSIIEVLGEYDLVKFISPLLQSSYEIMEAAVASDGLLIEYASENLRDDPEFVKKAIEQNPEAIKFASNTVLDNEEVVRLAVEKDPMLFVCASYRLRTDKELIEELMEKNVSILQFVPSDYSHYFYFAKPGCKEDVFMKTLQKLENLSDLANDEMVKEDDEEDDE